MGIQNTPVDSSATVVTRHATSQSASRWRSVVKVRNDCTGWSSRSGGTATTCVLPPQSIPAASGLIRSNTVGEARRETRGRRGRDSAIGHLQPRETSEHREHASEQTPKRDRHAGGVTNDQYVTPRTTLLDGHHDAHQCRDGLGARMRRHRMSTAATTAEWPAVYSEMSQGNAQVGRYSRVMG